MFCTAEPASGSVIPMLISESPSAAAGNQRSFIASGPRCSMPRGGPLKVSWQQMAADTSARAISSSTMDASTSPSPMPPHCSPTVIRSRSAAASALRTSAGAAPSSSAWWARGATSRIGYLARELAQGALVLRLRQEVVARRAGVCRGHQPSSVPTMPTKLTHSPGAPPRLWVSPNVRPPDGGDLSCRWGLPRSCNQHSNSMRSPTRRWGGRSSSARRRG